MNDDFQGGFRFPRWPVGLTVLVAALLIWANRKLEWINETTNLDPGMIRLGSTGMLGLVILVWLVWLVFFSGLTRAWRWSLAGLVVLSIVAFSVLFKRVSDGDVGLVRFEPRFWGSQLEVPQIDPKVASGIDLTSSGTGDFVQFLGPNRNGRVDQVALDPDWAKHAPKRLWKRTVGEGWSGFVVANGFAVTQEQRGPDECVVCYDIETGEPVWVHQAATRLEDTMALGRVGPRATPTIDQGRVYVQGGTGWLYCLDGRDGTVIWQVNVPETLGIEMIRKKNARGLDYEFEDSPLSWGRAASPLIHDGKLFVAGGGPQSGSYHTLLALDPETGDEIWRAGTVMISYGSPGVATLLGRTMITLVAEDRAMGFDPDTGEVLWSVDWPGASNANASCSQVTAVGDDQILLSKGYSIGGKLVRLKRTGNQIVTEEVWHNPRVLKTKFNSPIIHGEFAYSLSDGFLECTHWPTGRRKWKKRKRFGHGQMLGVGDYLLVHSEHGELILVAANPDRYSELGSIATIDGVCWNTLCLSHDRLLVRSEVEAACFELSVLEETDSIDD